MKKTIQPILLLALSFSIFSCTSDDNSKVDPPVIEKTYHLSQIEQNYYDEDPETGKDFLLHTVYNLDYDADYNLNKINYKDQGYLDNALIREQSLTMNHTLDEQGRLKLYEIKDGETVLQSYTYTYEHDLLKSTTFNLLNQGGAFTSDYLYNENKQLITNKALAARLLVNYAYNTEGQINQFRINGESIDLTYDDKISPFYNLPYDFTCLLINFDRVFPYTYKFPNNITTFTIRGDDRADVEFTYNEANLPVKAIYYDGKKEESEVAFDITYTYEIKETIKK